MRSIEPLKNASKRKVRHGRGGASKKHREWRDPPGGDPMSFDRAHRGCVDKTRFWDKRTARSAAERLGMRVYKCRFCGCWHLTSAHERSGNGEK